MYGVWGEVCGGVDLLRAKNESLLLLQWTLVLLALEDTCMGHRDRH